MFQMWEHNWLWIPDGCTCLRWEGNLWYCCSTDGHYHSLCCFLYSCQSGFSLWMLLDRLWSVLKCVLQLWCWPGQQRGLAVIFRQRNAVYGAHLTRGIHWPQWHTAVVLHLCVLAGSIKHNGLRPQLFCTSEDFQHHGELRKASHTHVCVTGWALKGFFWTFHTFFKQSRTLLYKCYPIKWMEKEKSQLNAPLKLFLYLVDIIHSV